MNTEKKKVLKHDSYRYIVDPYALEWKNDHYYLIGFSHKHQSIAHFRVDRLAGAEILNAGFSAPEDFDIAAYTNKMVDMFAGEQPMRVELLCENDMMRVIIDDYGESVPVRKVDGSHFVVTIEVNPSGTFYGWVFQFMGKIRILAPENCAEEMNRIARIFAEDR